MDNKLSELSKPRAFVVTGGTLYQDRAFTDKSTAERSKADRNDRAVVEPLYSQEYVSALLAELEASSLQCRGIEQERELFRLERTAHQLHAQELEQRIAELERANKSQDDHINQQQDRIDSLEKTNAGLGRGLAAAEKQLATPVRLPEGLAQKIKVTGYYEALNEMMDCVRAAGFKCVGDE